MIINSSVTVHHKIFSSNVPVSYPIAKDAACNRPIVLCFGKEIPRRHTDSDQSYQS